MQEFINGLLIQQLKELYSTLITNRYLINVLQLLKLSYVIYRPIKNYYCTQCCCQTYYYLTRRSQNIKLLAIIYKRPAKIQVYRYSCEELGRQSFKAIPLETIDVAVLDREFQACEESFVHVPIARIITAAQDKDNSNYRFLMPATLTQSGPIVYVSSNISVFSKILSIDPKR